MTRLAMLVVAGVCLLPALLLGCATAWTDAGQDRMLRSTVLIGYGNPMFGLSGNTGISLITPSSALCDAIAKHGGGDA
tara:strand:- start:449 stop:682 length:234 start_codon:yes stop_codon:yes gene_type:complete